MYLFSFHKSVKDKYSGSVSSSDSDDDSSSESEDDDAEVRHYKNLSMQYTEIF